MKLSRHKSEEPAKHSEAPTVIPAALEAAYPLPDAFRAQAQVPSASELPDVEVSSSGGASASEVAPVADLGSTLAGALILPYGHVIDGLDLPEGWKVQWMGYGGAGQWETKTYRLSADEGVDLRGGASRYEIRVPMDPALFPPKAVRAEYACVSAITLAEAVAGIFGAMAEKAAAEDAARVAREQAAARAAARKTIQTCDLTGTALDWAVAACAGETVTIRRGDLWLDGGALDEDSIYCPSLSPDQAWPIIERERISVLPVELPDGTTAWAAEAGVSRAVCKTEHWAHDPMFQLWADSVSYGPTALVAAMRCYVESRMGKQVQVPLDLRN